MIEVKNAVMRFDDRNALDGISLTIPEGCAYGLLGSNGAGKSTLMRVLSGIYRLNGGEALIDGEAVYDNAPLKERVFFINDETVQFNNMTLAEMKQYYRSFYSSFDEGLWQKLHSTLGLPMKKRLSTFSKGMKRQAAVICGIACRTPYLFLDEAFDGLDPTMRIIVKQMLIDAMVDSGLTVIFSSHNLGEIDEFCDRVGTPPQRKGHLRPGAGQREGKRVQDTDRVRRSRHPGGIIRRRRGYPPPGDERKRRTSHRPGRPGGSPRGGGEAFPEALRRSSAVP